MLDPSNIFAPYIDGPGLVISVSSGIILTPSGIVSSPLTIMALQPLTTNYVYFNVSGGSLQSNTSGFPASILPIATVTTSSAGILTLVDSRPDVIFAASGGGGGGGSADSVQSLNSSQTISFGAAINLFVKATAGSGGITLTLPSATLLTGQKVCISKVDSAVGIVTVSGAVVGTYYLSSQYQYATFESDGTSWFIVANN